ncbi:hypothetical protein HPB49_022609 [Dermacentor silvarum]|uniref:Uncharacterized protein n=1 Tax=Dermacentor silvarum TaxID=543639 RepID=A0ACB8DKV9_DERSI|nr:hypothetical protein HPB49_022609 [Dermacentor silvarum]
MQLFSSWKPRTGLSLLHPDIEQRMKEKLEQTKQSQNPRRDRTVTYRCHTGEVSAHPTLGIPQGSPISPLLWNIVISGLLDVPMLPGVAIQAYADDTVIVVPGENRAAIERTAALALQRVAEWSSRSKVTISVTKSFFLAFPHRSAAVRGPHLKRRWQPALHDLRAALALRLTSTLAYWR